MSTELLPPPSQPKPVGHGWFPSNAPRSCNQIADRVAQHAEVLARLESANTVSR
jgi:hypothetical protein